MHRSQPLVALIVDDVKENRMILSRLLERQDFKTVCAENGKLAIAQAQNNSFDIIFMDVMMPEMDGIEATREIRKNGYTGLIVAITAAVNEETRCFESGMNDFITKPILFEPFIKKLQNWFPEEGKTKA
jgi:CheY-like chemotaxis protein